MNSISSTQEPGLLPGRREFFTIRESAVKVGVGDDYFRWLVVFLLEQGYLVGKIDVLEIPPRPNAIRNVRKRYRQFRIHRNAIEKIKAYLAPKVDRLASKQ